MCHWFKPLCYVTFAAINLFPDHNFMTPGLYLPGSAGVVSSVAASGSAADGAGAGALPAPEV